MLRTERGFQRDRWHRGYLLGSVLGWAGGAAVAVGLGKNADHNDLWVLATPIGVMAGGYVGSRIGASRKREVWETVPSWTGGPVRVTLSDSERVVGVVSRITRDGLELLLPEGPRFVAMANVARIERRTVQRQWKRGLVVGAVAGAAIGLLGVPIGATDEDPSTGELIAAKMAIATMVGPFSATNPVQAGQPQAIVNSTLHYVMSSLHVDYPPGGHLGSARPVVHGTPASSSRPSSAGRSVSTSCTRSG